MPIPGVSTKVIVTTPVTWLSDEGLGLDPPTLRLWPRVR